MGDSTPMVTIKLKGKEHNVLLNEKTFRTGSTGFHGFGKLEIAEGERYQVNCMLILIGSKPKK